MPLDPLVIYLLSALCCAIFSLNRQRSLDNLRRGSIKDSCRGGAAARGWDAGTWLAGIIA